MRLRVLLVDDDPSWIDLLAFKLTKRGILVTKTLSAGEAEKILRCQDFDLIVTDLVMPVEDGLSFRRRMRTAKLSGTAEFLFLSGSPMAAASDSPVKPIVSKTSALDTIAMTIEELARLTRDRGTRLVRQGRADNGLQPLLWRIRGRLSPVLKRVVDVLLASMALVLSLPVLLVVVIAIKLEDGGPVFFVQRRVGRGGRTFPMLKFRSMRQDADQLLQKLRSRNDHADSVTFKMKKDPRITRVGRIIRRASFDEFPQFWNVICGSMSLVGPRPPTVAEVREYGVAHWQRLDVTPGITGLWQVNGRGDVPFEEQVNLDREYVQNRGLLSDFKILCKTIPAVLSGRGAY